MAQQSPRVVATLIWAALLAGPTVFLGVALFLVVSLRGGAGLGAPLAEPALIGGSLVLSVVTVALSWLWAVRMRIARPAQGAVAQRGAAAAFPPGPEADAVARLVVACALCEGGALAAVIVFLLTGNTLALAPYALSWLALAAHFPGDRHWAQLSGLPAGAARSPMIRG
ncbi:MULTISPECIES: hypothetical protein [Anaeromyxobacter]|uniref:hypothetical protein n=1 Tax=Anaeromyxobacter TaxID=161492 RepID=UPI001F5846FE|nr:MULTISPECIES: hypothetical protein [unclassified Anaeromyxobacter]